MLKVLQHYLPSTNQNLTALSHYETDTNQHITDEHTNIIK